MYPLTNYSPQSFASVINSFARYCQITNRKDEKGKSNLILNKNIGYFFIDVNVIETNHSLTSIVTNNIFLV